MVRRAHIPVWILVYIFLFVLYIKATDLELYLDVHIKNDISLNVFHGEVPATVTVVDTYILLEYVNRLCMPHVIIGYCRMFNVYIVDLFFLERYRNSNKLEAIMRNISSATRVPAIVYRIILLFIYMCVCLTIDQMPLNMWHHTSDTPVPSILLDYDRYIFAYLHIFIWLPRTIELMCCVQLIALYLCEANHDTIYCTYVIKEHVLWGEQTINVTYIQVYMYDKAISGWVEQPPKPYVSGLHILKVMHDLDKEMVLILRLRNSYQVPRTFMDGELNAECQALWSRVHDGIVRSGTVAYIPVGSSVEGGILCRMFSSDPDSSFMDFDQLRVFDNLCFTDYNTTFGPSPDHPGWYWVNKDVMCSRLANIDGYVKIFSITKIRPLNELDVTFKHRMKRSGPALTQMFTMLDHTDNSELKLSADTVFACQLDFWPPEVADWLTRTRQWPSQDVVDQISQQPCFLVHKPPSTRPEDMDKWSLSFTLAEQMLCMRRSEGMKLTYFCFKAIFYTCLHVKVDDKEFSSYLCKTVMMWALEELHPGQWTDENLLTNLLFLFSKLDEHIKCKHLPHYFIPDLNVMRDIPESMFAIIRDRVKRYNLLSIDLSIVCPDKSDNELWDFITSIQEQANVINTWQTIADRTMDTMGWKPSNNHDNQEIIIEDPDEHTRSRIFWRAVLQMCDISRSSIDFPVNIPPGFTTEKEYIKFHIEESCHDELIYFESAQRDVECMLQAY